METRAAAGTLEREWQLEADDLRAVVRALWSVSVAPGYVVGAVAAQQITDVYYETDDWRLHRAGYALRIRRTGQRVEAALKALARADGELQQRREITEPLAASTPEALAAALGPVATRVRAVCGERPLAALFEVRTRRHAYPLRRAGRVVAEVALDRTTIARPRGSLPVRLARVEVEVGAATPAEVAPFVKALRDVCGLRPARMSKYEAGLRACALSPAPLPDLGPTTVDESASIGDVALAALRTGFASLLAHEPGTRLGEDIEELHEMRVAIRRLRATLRLFHDTLPARVRGLGPALRWLGAILGAVRDLDVQLAQLAARRERLQGEERAALEPVIALLGERREAARRRMLQAFDSRRYEHFVVAAADVLRRGPARTPAARRAALAAAPDLLAVGYRKLRKLGDAMGEHSDARAYHRLRIRGKRLRYALECLQGIYGKPLRAALRALVALQKVLGRYHDADVAADHLRALCTTEGGHLPPRTLFVLGALAEREARRARKLRRRAVKPYRVLRGAAWKRLRDVMAERRAKSPAPAPVAVVRRRRGPRRAEPPPPTTEQAVPAGA